MLYDAEFKLMEFAFEGWNCQSKSVRPQESRTDDHAEKVEAKKR